MRVRIIGIAAFLLLTGCASDLNRKEASIHFEAAQRFDRAGDYASAREQYGKALVDARLAGAPPATISMLTYNFGRTTGYTCHLDESEKYLVDALELEESVTGPNSGVASMRVLELARLSFDRDEFEKSAAYYDRGIRIVSDLGVAQSDPIGLANALDEYSLALKKVGRESDARDAARRADDLRRFHPGARATFSPTRYKCPKWQLPELVAKANAGDARSQFMLGAAYDSGVGAPRDATEAVRWYRASADQGFAEAQNSLGSALQAEKRFTEALPWYEKAAAQGHAQATNNLAYLYDLGLGVPQSRRRGFELYSKAADLGWAEAMWNLANMYGAGQLGKVDPLMACVWAVRANRFASSNERQIRANVAQVMPELEKMLSSDALAKCREDGENWRPATQPGS